MTPDERFGGALALAERVADRAARRGLPRSLRDDARQEALLGLWRAARRFDPARCRRGEDAWPGYAFTACRRAVAEWCRDSLGHAARSPLRRAAVARLARATRLDGSPRGDPVADRRAPPPAAGVDAADLLAEALSRLRPASRAVLLGLAAGRTQQEVAAALGVSASRVCQVAAAARTFLAGTTLAALIDVA